MDILKITSLDEFPDWLSKNDLKDFLYQNLKPYEDAPYDIESGLNYALSEEKGQGGFILVGAESCNIVGIIVMVYTGMAGYVPENLLLFASVDPKKRGQGIGKTLIEKALDEAEGDVKLHVEYDNPAKKLYERIGFENKYADMRYTKNEK